MNDLEVICGGMFSGKSEELIRRLKRSIIAKQHVQVFKPDLDNRWREYCKVISRGGGELDAIPVPSAHSILDRIDATTTTVGIDEVQFFDEGILEVVRVLQDRGLRVIVAGLDMDFRGEPFGCMPALMAMAEHVDKMHAICVVCTESASRTQRLVNGVPAAASSPTILVGDIESYEARCRKCHIVA